MLAIMGVLAVHMILKHWCYNVVTKSKSLFSFSFLKIFLVVVCVLAIWYIGVVFFFFLYHSVFLL